MMPMRTAKYLCVLAWAAHCGLVLESAAVSPPVARSTHYTGAYSNIIHYPVQPWMNTNTVSMTVEAWVFCNDLNGFQAFVARHFTTNLWFGLSGNRLRFYRSGGRSADSDGTLVAGRWTHVAVTYDGVSARFFINGAGAGTKALASAGNNCTNSLSLGGQRDVLGSGDSQAAGYAFDGYLDEVRLWTVARTASAIVAGMNSEVRSGAGLLATFGTGGGSEDLRGVAGVTPGIPAADRWSGFGLLPANLCIPRTANGLRVDANIDLLNEYRGAETLVLRSTASATTPDQRAYLMVSTNATNHHLFVGVPDLPQAGLPQIPIVQILADVNVANGTNLAVGDWECRLTQDTFQGGRIYGTNPPFIPNPAWLSWGQSVSNWQALTAESFEFHQSYEFRIHARHLNYFTNAVGLMVRYYDYSASADQLAGPRSAVTNLPATYARADWCGRADSDLSVVTLAGSVTNVAANTGVAGRPVYLYSGDSELSGFLLASTTTDAQGKFSFTIWAPSERRLAIAYTPSGSAVYLDPSIDASASSRVPVTTNSPFSVTYLPCPSLCTYARVNFRYRQLGPVQLTGVNPSSVPASVLVRTNPRKVTATSSITVSGTNFHAGVNVFFKGSGCTLSPPDLCTGDWHEANVVSVAADGLSLVAEVPSALGVTTVTRGFQIVAENPSFGSTGGAHWIYGPGVTVTPPAWPQLHGFEFKNMDDGPSWEEFEASYGESIFATVPFTDTPIPGVRDPYYGLYFLVYMAWMDIAHGSCSGFAATSRLMADGTIPAATFDRPDSGDGVHGVLFPNGYVGRPPCRDDDSRLCAPRPGRWTGFDLFQPFRPINVWARITSLQGAQTSAEFLNSWLGQLHRPIAFGPRRGISVGDPALVLSRVRTDARANLVPLGGRDFQDMHTVTPYGVVEEHGLSADLLAAEPRAGFSLIKVYDSNWPGVERFVEIDRAQNTFRYLLGFRDGAPNVAEGAGLYYIPMGVFRGRRHAPGPTDIAANLEHFLRILHTGTSVSSLRDGAGGTAGWTGSNLVNTYEGALPFVPPGFVFGEPDRPDRTMYFLPETNAPAGASFHSAGSNVFLHYALGGGDIAYGFNAPDAGASNSVDGILIGLNQGLLAVGLRAGAPVTGFGAIVASRDGNGQSRVFVIDAGAGPITPDLQLERDGFKSLTIRNRSAAPFGFRLNVAGHDLNAGTFERAYEYHSQPGQSTLTLRLPENPATMALTRELDTNNDGVPDTVDEAPASGQLRVSDDAGLIVLRWRQAGFGELLERSTQLNSNEWAAAGVPISTEGADRVARVQRTGPSGFYRLKLEGTNCLDLSVLAAGPRPNPWETNRFRFEALSATGALLPQNAIVTRDGHTGLDVVHTALVHLLDDYETVHLDVVQTSELATIEAVGPLGTVVARQTLTGGLGPQRVSLRGFRGRLQHVRVVSTKPFCQILNVCGVRAPSPVQAPTRCVTFSNAAAGQFPSPYSIGEVTVTAAQGQGSVVIGPVAGLPGNWLRLAGPIDLKWKLPCGGVRLRLRDLEGAVTATAYDGNGALVAAAGPLPGSDAPQELVLSGPGISQVVLSSSSDKADLQEICFLTEGL